MPKTRLRIFIHSIIIVAFLSSCNPSKKATIHIEPGMVGMVGYGSLMSLQSMESTLERAYTDSIYRIHLEGFIRDWNFIFPNYDTTDPRIEFLKYDGFYINDNDTLLFDKSLAMNIMPKEKGRVNCVLYFISSEEMTGFDKREWGYERIDVTDRIEEYEFTGGKVFTFKAIPEYTYNHDLDLDGIILDKSYVDRVTNACDSIGIDFREEFEASTIAYNPEIVAPVIWKKVR